MATEQKVDEFIALFQQVLEEGNKVLMEVIPEHKPLIRAFVTSANLFVNHPGARQKLLMKTDEELDKEMVEAGRMLREYSQYHRTLH
jgi:hypothetical protein